MLHANPFFVTYGTDSRELPNGQTDPGSYTGWHRVVAYVNGNEQQQIVMAQDGCSISVAAGGSTSWVLQEVKYLSYTVPRTSGTAIGKYDPWTEIKMITPIVIDIAKEILPDLIWKTLKNAI